MPEIIKPIPRVVKKAYHGHGHSSTKNWTFMVSALEGKGINLEKYWDNGFDPVFLGPEGTIQVNTLADA